MYDCIIDHFPAPQELWSKASKARRAMPGKNPVNRSYFGLQNLLKSTISTTTPPDGKTCDNEACCSRALTATLRPPLSLSENQRARLRAHGCACEVHVRCACESAGGREGPREHICVCVCMCVCARVRVRMCAGVSVPSMPPCARLLPSPLSRCEFRSLARWI